MRLFSGGAQHPGAPTTPPAMIPPPVSATAMSDALGLFIIGSHFLCLCQPCYCAGDLLRHEVSGLIQAARGATRTREVDPVLGSLCRYSLSSWPNSAALLDSVYPLSRPTPTPTVSLAPHLPQVCHCVTPHNLVSSQP